MDLPHFERQSELEGFLNIFSRIASKSWQERVWIGGGEVNECDSFDDTINDFFGVCDYIIKNYKIYKINDIQLSLIIKFRNLLETFASKYDLPVHFIHLSEWDNIVKIAQEILTSFSYPTSP